MPLAAQAKTFNEFIERTFESVRQNVAFLFKILGAFMRIIFCLRGKKRTHVDAVAQEVDTGLNAAAALPPSGKKKLVAKVAAKFSKLFGGGGEEGGEGGGKGGEGGGKKGKPVKQAPPSRAAAAAAAAETGDDLVEAYIKFAKEAAAAEAHADEAPSPRPAQLAKPGLRPGLMGPAGGGGGSSSSNNR